MIDLLIHAIHKRNGRPALLWLDMSFDKNLSHNHLACLLAQTLLQTLFPYSAQSYMRPTSYQPLFSDMFLKRLNHRYMQENFQHNIVQAGILLAPQ